MFAYFFSYANNALRFFPQDAISLNLYRLEMSGMISLVFLVGFAFEMLGCEVKDYFLEIVL